MKSKQKNFQVNASLQKTFLTVWIAGYLMSLGFILRWVIQQYPDNHNLSGYLLISVQSILLPAILFALAYFSGNKNSLRLARWFEGALLSTMGLMLVSLLNEISFLHYPTLNGYWQSVWYSLGLMLVGVIIYGAVLYKYRKSS